MTTEPEPTRALEVERKYDADAGTPLPDWGDVPGVARVGSAEDRELDARYFDTADLALSRAGVALRRRTGGPDAGWHIKGPRQGDARLEIAWPLDEDERMPQAVLDAVADWAAPPFTPLARIENSRRAYDLYDADGGVVAEFVDDTVRTTDLRGGAQRAWREWEVELGPAAPTDAAGRAALFAAVERAVFAAGGRVAASDSKLARALGA